jgi:hypothetical protein
MSHLWISAIALYPETGIFELLLVTDQICLPIHLNER